MKPSHLLFISTVVSLAACSSGGNKTSHTSSSSSSSSSGSLAAFDIEDARKVLNTNADIAFAVYSDAVDTATALQTAIATFKATPTQPNLDAAKIAWLVSREPYEQSEVFRFRLSPIDSSNYSNEDGIEGDINAWPLGEALIDDVVTGTDFGEDQVGVSDHATGVNYPTENIIHSSVVIDQALIANTATADDEHDVIAGYHAIEFMLWGQDLNLNGSADTLGDRELSTVGNIISSGGHRPLTDFTSDDYAARRFQYLEVVAAKLVADLTTVRDGWAMNSSYRTKFTTVDTESEARQKLTEILVGMGTLSTGELAGERIQIAFSSESQEDEHSCFSDNTHRDIVLAAKGIANSYYGDYAGYDSNQDGLVDVTTRAVNGYGFDNYLTDAGLSTTATAMETALATTKTAYDGIDAAARAGMPFDVQIQNENRNADSPVYKTILALTAQTNIIGDIAEALGITSSVVEDGATGCDTTKPDQTCD